MNSAAPRALIGLGHKSLREVYDERTPLYERHSHFTVDTENQEADEIVARVLDFLGVDKKNTSVTL